MNTKVKKINHYNKVNLAVYSWLIFNQLQA